MPVVPSYEPQAETQALPTTRVEDSSTIESFGGGRARTDYSPLMKAAKAADDNFVSVYEQEKKRADEIAALTLDTKLAETQTQVQAKVSKMMMRDAFAAPDYAKSEWDKAVQAVSESATNDEQKLAVTRSATNRWEALNRAVQFHVADQSYKYDEAETKGAIETSRASAVLNARDDEMVQTEIEHQQMVREKWAQRNGIPLDSEAYKAAQKEDLSKTHLGVIEARLNVGADASAKEYFEASKGQMAAPELEKASKLVENAQTIHQADETWAKVRGMMLPDGQPDERRMEAAVMSDPSLSLEKRVKVWEFVKARAGESIVQKAREDSAVDRSFMNGLLTARQQGRPLEDGLSLAAQISRDPKELAEKQAVAQKIWAPPTESNWATKTYLWRKVNIDGDVSLDEIQKAADKNLLTPQDAYSLKQEYWKSKVQGRSDADKASWRLIQDQAIGSGLSNSGTDKKLDKYLDMVRIQADGKSPEERAKIADDLLKKMKGTGFLPKILDWGQKQKYEVDADQQMRSDKSWGAVYEQLGGKEVTEAIKSSTGGTAQGVREFVNQMGGVDAVKPGTPANNAIRSLLKWEKPVTPDTIDWVLKRYPDGKM